MNEFPSSLPARGAIHWTLPVALERQPLPEIGLVSPSHDQCPTCWHIPSPRKIRVAAWTHACSIVVGNAALQRLDSGAPQLAAIVFEERAAAVCHISGRLFWVTADDITRTSRGCVPALAPPHARRSSFARIIRRTVPRLTGGTIGREQAWVGPPAGNR